MLAELLALWHIHGLGPKTLSKLLNHFGDCKRVLNAKSSELTALGFNAKLTQAILNPNWPLVNKALAWQDQAADHHIICMGDAAYPRLLQETHGAPCILYAIGDISALHDTQLAMVGARRASFYGKSVAKRLAGELAQAGFVITSGLALGIDGVCHQAALDNQQKTVAVLGCGLNQMYPAKHRSLAALIAQQGVLISEFALDTPPKPEYFPRRNRLISGLSVGVIVVEAALKSGSLITARFALEQGREVFAVPGSIQTAYAEGCHYLIQQGAHCVHKAQDIIDEMAITRGSLLPTIATQALEIALDRDHQKLVQCVAIEPTAVDAIIAKSGFEANKVLNGLTELELKGLINRHPLGYIRVQRTHYDATCDRGITG